MAQTPDPMYPSFTARNPIVAAAERIRARRAIEEATTRADLRPPVGGDDAESALRAFAEGLQGGIARLNAILGERGGVKLVRFERPLRLRLRFREKRIRLDLDDVHQLVRIEGEELDGEWQFAPDAPVPTLINLSLLSTDAAYGKPLTPSSLLRHLARDAELPPPEELRGPGLLQF